MGRPALVIYVENAGDFVVPLEAVEAVHAQKVIVNSTKLEPRLREAIGHAHNAEVTGHLTWRCQKVRRCTERDPVTRPRHP